MNPYRNTYRARCSVEHSFFDILEETRDYVWVSKTQRGDRYTMRGVSAKYMDVVVVPFPGPTVDRSGIEHPVIQVVEVGVKAGHFDGAERIRVTVRWMPEHQTPIEEVLVSATEIGRGTLQLDIGDEIYEFPQYRHAVDVDRDLAPIIRWHYSHYYRFLSEDQIVSAELALFAELVPGCTLAEVNRVASRVLYRIARDAGWRKLTQRERRKLGLSGQWHSDADYAAAQVRIGHPSGAGQYTLESARGCAD